ncbi:MAG: hypothetical protein IPF65_10965 [Polaromonas sp.]|nr:hypothetical protein [Polaromonas sp.]
MGAHSRPPTSVDITTSATTSACPGTAANTNGSGQISGLSNLTNGVTNQCLTVTVSDMSVAINGLPATAAPGAVLSGPGVNLVCTNVSTTTAATNATCTATAGPSGRDRICWRLRGQQR